MAGGNVFIPAFPVLDNASIVAALGYTPVNQAGDTMTGGLVVALGSIAANTQNFNGTATWNNSGVTFTALKQNVTDTASNSASLLMDLQVAGASKFKVDKSGTITGTGNVSFGAGDLVVNRGSFGSNASTPTGFSVGVSGSLGVAQNIAIPAGGSITSFLSLSSVSGFGLYFGSGAPSIAAAKGSWYLRSDGSGINNRAYINTDGSTTWTPVVTVG